MLRLFISQVAVVQHCLHRRHRYVEYAVCTLHGSMSVAHFGHEHVFRTQCVHADSKSQNVGNGLIPAYLVKMQGIQRISVYNGLRLGYDGIDLLRRLLDPAADRHPADDLHDLAITAVMLIMASVRVTMTVLMAVSVVVIMMGVFVAVVMSMVGVFVAVVMIVMGVFVAVSMSMIVIVMVMTVLHVVHVMMVVMAVGMPMSMRMDPEFLMLVCSGTFLFHHCSDSLDVISYCCRILCQICQRIQYHISADAVFAIDVNGSHSETSHNKKYFMFTLERTNGLFPSAKDLVLCRRLSSSGEK